MLCTAYIITGPQLVTAYLTFSQKVMRFQSTDQIKGCLKTPYKSKALFPGIMLAGWPPFQEILQVQG